MHTEAKKQLKNEAFRDCHCSRLRTAVFILDLPLLQDDVE